MVFTSCNICGSDEYHEVCDIKIAPIMTPSKLVKCKKCGFFYANPRLSRETEEHYYRKQFHETGYFREDRTHIFKRSLHEIGKFLEKGRMVDIGCGTGHFMDLARRAGWEVKGVEVSIYAVNYAREKLRLDVIKGCLKDAQLKAEHFDAATMWNVLDQMYDPKANLIEINRILKKGGYLFIRVPNLYFHIKLFGLYKRFRMLFGNIGKPPSVFNLYAFDKNSIRKLLESTGFSDIIIKTEQLGKGLFFVRISGKKINIIRKLFNLIAKITYLISFGRIFASPSIFVIAQK